MKTLFKYIAISLFIILGNVPECYGQENAITWGEELDGKGLIKIIGEEGDFIYALQHGTKLLTLYTNFLTIDKSTLEVIKTKKLKLSGLTTIPLNFSILDGKLQALVVKKGKNFYKIIFDLDLNEISNELVVKFDKSVYAAESVAGMKMLIPMDLISSYRSMDESKVVVMVTKSGKKREGVEFFMFDINTGLTQLYNTSLKGSKSTSIQKITDVDVQINGVTNVLVKRYIDGDDEEENKKPNYNYVIYKIGLDTKETMIELPSQDIYWKSASIKNFSDGSILVAGVTHKKAKSRPEGYQIVKFNNSNELLFNKSNEITFDGTVVELAETFYLRDILLHNDMSFALVGEDAWSRTYTNANGMQEKDRFYSNDIIVDGFDENGERKWSNVLYRYIEEKGDKNLFSEPVFLANESGINIFYNTTAKNIDPINDDRPYKDKLPSKKPIVLSSSISKTGKMSISIISQEEKRNFVSDSFVKTAEHIYVVGANNNKMKKMYLGKIKN